MITEVDKRLKMLNSENYEVQFLWTSKEEIRNDVIEFFNLDEEYDKEIINNYLNYDNEEYVYSDLGAGLILLEEALDYEFEQAKGMIEFYDDETQEEILEWFYDEVRTVSFKFQINKEEHEQAMEGKEYLIETAINYLEEEIGELQEEGYNTEYIEDTITFNITGDRDIMETYFLVVK